MSKDGYLDRMDIYKNKSKSKIYLAIAGLFIVAVTMIYTNYLVNKLKLEERKKIEQWKTANEKFNETGVDCDVTIYEQILSSNTTIPMILLTEINEIYESVNINDTSHANLEKELEDMKESGINPILGSGYASYIYYRDSDILVLLKYLPLVLLFMISAFIVAGYMTFSALRRSEQNRVWAGMAKETAHQLGTPISAIIGWIETLKEDHKENDETQEILYELNNDVSRLELIADRFSKIGSDPVLTKTDIISELRNNMEYMKRRSPRKVLYHFPESGKSIMVPINKHLFNWVIENLLRNAIDSMGSDGNISSQVVDFQDKVVIDITDTGKGIESNKFKLVFQPGHTTKKRGWGLGLSLAKRIIEEYHKGKIFVKKSEVGVGTTFSIHLPK